MLLIQAGWQKATGRLQHQVESNGLVTLMQSTSSELLGLIFCMEEMVMTCFTVLKLTTNSKVDLETTNFLVMVEMTLCMLIWKQISARTREI